MQVETIRDILQWTSQFHAHLSKCLARGAKQNTSERATMLLRYLADQETRLAGVLAESEKTASINALNTWCYEYMDKHSIVHDAFCDPPFGNLQAGQVVGIVMGQHQQVIELYRNLSARSDIPEAQELLESLQSLEEHEAMQMAQSGNRFSDM